MSSNSGGGDQQDIGDLGGNFNTVISDVLKYGVIASAVLVLVGILVLVWYEPAGFPTTVGQLMSGNYGRPTVDVATLFGGLAVANPIFILQLGLIVLLATPVLRVAVSVVLFLLERDMLYVGITVFVLAVLLVSVFVIGPIEAAA